MLGAPGILVNKTCHSIYRQVPGSEGRELKKQGRVLRARVAQEVSRWLDYR